MIYRLMPLMACMLFAAQPVAAEDYEDYEPATTYGLRLGFGIEPEQIVIGSQGLVGSL